MKPKQIIITIIVALGGGLGIYWFTKSHQPAAAESDESDSLPTVVSVETGVLKRMTLYRVITGFGTVTPAPATADQPAADAPLAAPSAGIVATINVVAGQSVQKGDVLMELNSGAATADYVKAEVARQKKLFTQHNTSQKALQDAEAQFAALQVVAPLSGTVTRVNVKPGAAVDASTVVAEVMDLSRLVVKTQIPAAQAGELKPGQDARVLTDPAVNASLTFISPTVDANNDTVLAWATLPANSGLRPGQFVPLRIITAVHTNCLAAPEASVVTGVNGQSTLSLVNGTEATQTPVQTGLREDGWVEITDASLKAGDTVVTVGAYGLPKQTQIEAVKPAADESSATNLNSAQAP